MTKSAAPPRATKKRAGATPPRQRSARVRRPPAAGSRSGASVLGMHERIRDRRRAVADAGRRRRLRLLLSGLALALLACLGVAATYSPLFAVTGVRVTGAEGARAEEVRAASGLLDERNLLFADLGAAARRVEVLPWVAGATARRLPPSTLEVSVRVREPAAVVRLSDASWLVAADGVLIGGGTREGLVQIDAPGAALPSVGFPVEQAGITDALAVHAGLAPELRDRVVRYDARAGLRLLLVEGEQEVWVRVGDAERVDTKSRAVQLVLEAARRPDAPSLEGFEIDVRAPDNPVLAPAVEPSPTGD